MEENRKTKEKTQLQIAKDFGIPASTLSTILAKKEDKRFEDSDSRKRKRDAGLRVTIKINLDS